MTFEGAMTAIVTPFRDGKLDEEALREHIRWQIASGIDGIIVCGTTGEAATMDIAERTRAVHIAVEEAAGRVPIIAGTGSNATQTTIESSRQAVEAGADALLIVTPYYNKPTQEGLYQHYRAVAETVSAPIILYNVPGRTACNMLAETTLRLAEVDAIVGIKEASGDLEQIRTICTDAPEGFVLLSGEDAQNEAIYRLGGRGCISVTANVVPDRVAQVWRTHIEGEGDRAQALQEKLVELNRAMFFETNPIPVKTALALMGRMAEEFRLPLTPMGEENREKLIAVLRAEQLLA